MKIKPISLAVAFLFGLSQSINLNKIDVAANQRKLYAANMKVHGGEIQIYDANHVGDVEYEEQQADLRLMGVDADIRLGHKNGRSSLDDPVADRTVSSVKPSSPLEDANRDWLTQKSRPSSAEHVLLEVEEPLRNYHGRLQQKDDSNAEIEEEFGDYDLVISPEVVGYSKQKEILQANSDKKQAEDTVEGAFVQIHKKALKQSEKREVEEDNFVAEQAKKVEEQIDILTDAQEKQKAIEDAAAEKKKEDEVRAKRLMEFNKQELWARNGRPENPADSKNLQVETNIGVNDEYGFFTKI